MDTTRIFWSGLTGRTGREALKQIQLRQVEGVKIVMGAKRTVYGADDCDLRGEEFEDVKWRQYGQLHCDHHDRLSIRSEVDVIVDFSHPTVFDEVLRIATCTGKPLIVGTSGLSNRQTSLLHDATNYIPVFRGGGNFRFGLKKFIDEAVELAITAPDNFILCENLCRGASLPSKASQAIQRRVREATGKTIEVRSTTVTGRMGLMCSWKIGDLQYRTIGYSELARDVLEIAKVMASKPVKQGEFYNLDGIWNDLNP